MENVRAHENNIPLQDNQVHLLQEVSMGNQVMVVPPPEIDGEIRLSFLTLTQAMTT